MDVDDSTPATTKTVAVPEPFDRPAKGEFRFDMLLIGIVVLAAIVISNIWLRRRAERADSE